MLCIYTNLNGLVCVIEICCTNVWQYKAKGLESLHIKGFSINIQNQQRNTLKSRNSCRLNLVHFRLLHRMNIAALPCRTQLKLESKRLF